MKNSLLRFGAALFMMPLCNIFGQDQKVNKLWESEAVFKVPESVLYEKDSKMLYVSNIDGSPNAKDGKGSIGKMKDDGSGITVEWVSGLNGPKGMGMYKGTLYVSDIDEVVAIDVKKGKIKSKVPIKGAVFLNDVSVDNKGVVYVSDMSQGTVHRIENGAATLIMEGQPGINGVLCVGDDLYFLRKGELWLRAKNAELTKIAGGMEESTDGVEQLANGEFLVSCWSGLIYRVKNDGSVEQLLDTREAKSNTADIGLNATGNIVFVPTFFGNKVVAYQVK